MYIQVAVNIPSDKTFFYSVPECLRKDILVGKRVLVPLEKRRLTGYIIDVLSESGIETTKDIISILDTEPLFNEEDFRFYQWVSQYYIYPIGKTLFEILPSGIDPKSSRWIIPSKKRQDDLTATLSPSRQKIMAIFADFPDGLPISRLQNILEEKSIVRDIRALQTMELILVEDRTKKPDVVLKKEKIASLNPEAGAFPKMTKSRQALIDFLKLHGPTSLTLLRKPFGNVTSLVKALEQKGIVCVSETEAYRLPFRFSDIGKDEGTVVPNEDQQVAIREIINGMRSDRFSPYLLHGVTGSGKTEVYMNAMEETLRMHGSVLLLVPKFLSHHNFLPDSTNGFRIAKSPSFTAPCRKASAMISGVASFGAISGSLSAPAPPFLLP